ncbi:MULTISPECIES: Imm26 family immunity protein [unclassified Brenneria]|uniref:Imm26 family immunity protein n=1 Tax=unclassified Brenneria TaxID=2634434 RepID=UPI0018F07B04|nr:Imm26 family immunity protein [Brenneria sp. L3-3C-1]MBJ7223495.1 phosphotriesterase [Brenneria sp. L3-3C-1]MEE3644735.1 Imm26 family immunity protein [Brenneria sp. L3_3C_1]
MKLKKYDWKKKKKTLLRYIKPGDIFFFENTPGEYYFGRIMAKNSLGHFAEIFTPSTNDPETITLDTKKRIRDPIVLDSYSLFDRRTEGNWVIIANQEDYIIPTNEPIRFSYGAGPIQTKVDILGNKEQITEEEAKSLPSYSPMGDFDVKEYLGINQ